MRIVNSIWIRKSLTRSWSCWKRKFQPSHSLTFIKLRSASALRICQEQIYSIPYNTRRRHNCITYATSSTAVNLCAWTQLHSRKTIHGQRTTTPSVNKRTTISSFASKAQMESPRDMLLPKHLWFLAMKHHLITYLRFWSTYTGFPKEMLSLTTEFAAQQRMRTILNWSYIYWYRHRHQDRWAAET